MKHVETEPPKLAYSLRLIGKTVEPPISVRHIRAAEKANQLPVFMVGSRPYVTTEDFLVWLKRRPRG